MSLILIVAIKNEICFSWIDIYICTEEKRDKKCQNKSQWLFIDSDTMDDLLPSLILSNFPHYISHLEKQFPKKAIYIYIFKTLRWLGKKVLILFNLIFKSLWRTWNVTFWDMNQTIKEQPWPNTLREDPSSMLSSLVTCVQRSLSFCSFSFCVTAFYSWLTLALYPCFVTLVLHNLLRIFRSNFLDIN